MAERLHKMHSMQIRLKIQASVIIDRLHKHLMGKLKLKPTQIKAAEVLLDRSVPKLQQIQGPGDQGQHKLEVTVDW